MAKKTQKEILVFADWSGQELQQMGTLFSYPLRGKEVFSFEYDSKWLKNEFFQLLDPDLGFFAGPQYLNDAKKNNFGIFLDSSPDRWGRVLMKRREALLAKKEKRPQKKLLESDFLLGVHDEHRMGGLRFKLNPDGNFLDDNTELASPPWSSLRDLEFASMQIENDNAAENEDYLHWLKVLISPGSSLGGARPKAGVRDGTNNQWIAKFPSKHDEYDMAAWELVANRLGAEAGINVPTAEIKKINSKHHTFLTKRFDRENGQRRHFSSAMTMLGLGDGADAEAGVSCLDLAEFISRHSAQPNSDLEELWKRIVFNICISNTDDHLRNHGFILTKQGWTLSPAYDVNPTPHSFGLKLNISENDNSLDLSLAESVAVHFRVKTSRAYTTLKQISSVVRNWRAVAKAVGIKNSECDLLAGAFDRV